MQTEKINFLNTYLGLFIDHNVILEDMAKSDANYVVLDVRNAPAHIKKTQIKGALAIPAKDLSHRISELDKDKTYVVYDWTAGTTLGKAALLTLLSQDFEAYELACALEGWVGMNLPVEDISVS